MNRTQTTMAFPRIDHPEFAEFIRRFYGVSQPEAMAQRQPSSDRTDVSAADSRVATTAEMAAGRKRPRRIGPDMEG